MGSVTKKNNSLGSKLAVGLIVLMSLMGCTTGDLEDINFIEPDKIEPASRDFLYEIAQRTWKYLVFSAEESGIPADHIILKKDGKLHDADYTTATNLGLFLMTVPAAIDFDFLSPNEGEEWLEKIIDFMEAMPKSNGGLYYNYFKVKDGKPDENLYVSSVDNAWVAAGLVVASKVKNSELKNRIRKLYQDMDFSKFYDPGLGQMRLGYRDTDHKMDKYHYGLLNTEARLISMIALAKKQVPDEHWYRIYRTLPQEWDWQRSRPQGQKRTAAGIEYFAGYYTVDGMQVVPSWGGSLFETLMPLLVVPELAVAPRSFGVNDVRIVKLQKDFCLNKKGYPVWGLSPSSMPAKVGEFKYGEFGYDKLGSKGYPDKGVVTPHASILALEIDTPAVIENLKTMKVRFPNIWTEYGFYDAVDVNTGEVSTIYLTLDQSMIFLALHNYLKAGGTRARFFTDEIATKMAPILAQQRFFNQ